MCPAELLPLSPLLHAYTARLPSVGELGRLPGLGQRFAAIQAATATFLYPDFLDSAGQEAFAAALLRFYRAVTPLPLHEETLGRRMGLVRHGMAHLLRGQGSPAEKMQAFLTPSGAYHVAGLGPAFWSALLQGLQPGRYPGWLPFTLPALRRLGLYSPRATAPAGDAYLGILQACARLLEEAPGLTGQHFDHFLFLVGQMTGRSLWHGEAGPAEDPVQAAIVRLRASASLRERLRRRGAELAGAQELLEEGLGLCDGKRIGHALASADAASAARSTLDWAGQGETLTLWAGRLWEADADALPALLAGFWKADPLPGAGLWLPAAVLHLRDPLHFQPWGEEARQGLATLDDSAGPAGPVAERYRLFNETTAWLRVRYSLHPLEVADLLASLAPESPVSGLRTPSGGGTSRRKATGLHPTTLFSPDRRFGGLCGDTFVFLRELGHNNRREWMERQRGRYRFAVRQPLVELCQALAARYVEPVLTGVHGWQVDTEARSGRALTSICKNAYGRSSPYNTALWITFCQRGPSKGGPAAREREPQLFVRLDQTGLTFGLKVGPRARRALERLQQHALHRAEALHAALERRGALADTSLSLGTLDTPAALRGWLCGRTSAPGRGATPRGLEVARTLPEDSPLLEGDALVGEILLTFDRLLPLYACAVEDEPDAILPSVPASAFTDWDFLRETGLEEGWLGRARVLLELKRQLILQGVPGTGKTYVARWLARLLTGGEEGRVRLVQLHPGYSYEDMVEGIKVRTVSVGDRQEVTYPVEEGVLSSFAAEAARRPAEPHVLILDEINRGNLPRVFGELLYLLEYREQEVELPCSRRRFRLPANLYLLGTMNAADRSTAALDRALRRRFSFLEMAPDPRLLERWLACHLPPARAGVGQRAVALLERLNARLLADAGPHAQVGHSFFMTPDLDEERLGVIWQHHVLPLLEEHLAGHPGRLASYGMDQLLAGAPRRKAARTGA